MELADLLRRLDLHTFIAFDFVQDFPIVAHNLPFDLAFLSNLKQTHLEGDVENEGYDTVPLAQALLFFLPNHQKKQEYLVTV